MSIYYRPLYRRRGRPDPTALAAGVTAFLVVSAAVAVPASHTGPAPAPKRIEVPRGYSPLGWAIAFLHDDGKAATSCNTAFVVAWQRAEGTYGKLHNPLDTTQKMPGAYSVNSDGVKHYPSLAVGLKATVITIRNGRYGAIEAALADGHDAHAAASALLASPWGTRSINLASC